jgi:integrase
MATNAKASKRKQTRNAQGGGSIRQRKDGRWEARYTIGRDPGTGKQIQKSVYGDTQADVRKKLAQVTVDIDEGVFTEPSRLTVGAWLDIWLTEYVENAVKPLTFYSYKTMCNNHIKASLGALKLSALTAPAIQKFYNDLHKGSEDKAPISAKTIKNIHGVLHKALKQAVVLGYIKFNPASGCVLPRIVKKEIKPLEERDIATFMTAIQGHKFETLFIVALFTGMRQGELMGLTWDCVNLKDGAILVNKQLIRDKNNSQYYLTSLKNDKSRNITLAPFVTEVLRKHKVEQSKIRLMLGGAWGNADNLVFTNEIGECLKHPTVYENFKRVVNNLGLNNARFHDLRHSYAVAALQSGDDMKTVQENLGHHTAAFTLDVYGHVSERMKQESAQRMEKFIHNVKNLG